MSSLNKVYSIAVDIKNVEGKYSSYAKFFDDDRDTSIIKIKLLNNNYPIDLEGCTVEAEFILANNTYHDETCKIINTSEGIVELQLCQECLIVGKNTVRLSILKENEIANTPVITYEVKKGLYSDNPNFNDDPLTPVLSQMLLDVKVTKANQIELQERYEQSFPRIELKIKEVDEKIVELNTTKENFISSINTKIDNKISEIEVAKSDMTNTVSSKVNEVETRFNALTSSQQQDAEVIDARDGETSLKARLDRDIEKAKQVYVNVEGSHIFTDSSSGYAKDVEILGNTVQSASNLADIRSVGDKVEGQELYEIPVLSCGKNLFDGELEKGAIINGSPTITGYDTYFRSKNFIQVESGSNLSLSFKYNNVARNTFALSEYDSNFNFISKTSGENGSVKVNQKTRYVKFEVYAGINGTDINLISNIQLEEGTVATPYEPYQEDKLTILSPVQLEKVGDVADRMVCKDGVWGVEKNIETVVLNGSEDWVLASSYTSPNCKVFTSQVLVGKIIDKVTNNFELICDQFIIRTVYTTTEDTEGVIVSGTETLWIKILNSKLPTQDVQGFKQWLQANNVTVKYQLATPTFIPLPHSQQVKLRTFANKTNISFLTEIEGTIKAQVPKSLGATVNTHTEQINSLNKELDRVKKLEESTVSTVTTESDFTTVEATSNGYFEDVKLEGKTLVNLAPNSVKIPTDSVCEVTCVPIQQLKADTDYTIIMSNVPAKVSTSQVSFRTKDWVDRFKVTTNHMVYYRTPNQSAIDNMMYIICRLRATEVALTKEELQNIRFIILEGDHTQNPPSYFEGLKSVGGGVDEIVVSSNNNQPKQIETTDDNSITTTIDNPNYQSDKKRLLYYNNETQTWEKPILRQWDSIEKHANGKYYYHQRSKEVVLNGSEDWNIYGITSGDFRRFQIKVAGIFHRPYDIVIISDKFKSVTNKQWALEEKKIEADKNFINITTDILTVDEFKQWLQANNVTVVYELAEEKVYECTNIDLITYANETNYIVNSGVSSPKSTLKVHNNISNVVSLLQKKVSLLESNVKASQEVQDMMILETDMRMLDIELALMEFIPMKLNLGGSNMLRSATYFNFLKNHIINETYEKEYLENVMNKYLATGRINQDEYNELYKILYPPVYDIELPIEY